MELDDKLRTLRAASRDRAFVFRAQALALDADPEGVARNLKHEDIDVVRRLMIPAEHNPAPLRLGPYVYNGYRCLDNAVGLIELAWGDPGMVLACPSSSLAGLVVAELGDAQQQERYFSQVLADYRWTFFAVTEPTRGSDAMQMTTELREDGAGGHTLHGTKRYIGNGARGSHGVVFARTGRHPLSIRGVLVDAPHPALRAQTLDMVGLRGAAFSQLDFDGLPIGPDQLLGKHLPTSRRGFIGALHVFNHMRPHVAGIAVGIAQAVYDYTVALLPRPNAWLRAELDQTGARIESVRRLVYRAAAALDANPADGQLGSVAKLEAVRLAGALTRRAPELLGRAALLEHPLLEKWQRDVASCEFMEGTSNIQRLTIAAAHAKGEVATHVG